MRPLPAGITYARLLPLARQRRLVLGRTDDGSKGAHYQPSREGSEGGSLYMLLKRVPSKRRALPVDLQRSAEFNYELNVSVLQDC